MSEDAVPAIHFQAALVPHRSLPPERLRWLIWAALAGNLVIGAPLLVMGAWPVMGFMGLDVFLLWWLFRRNYHDARRRETLTLTDQELVVDRVSPDGDAEQHRLDAYWLRVEWDEPSERLVVVSRSNRLVIGRFLAPEVRRQVAGQLKAAVAAMRAPRYRHAWDN